MPSLHSSLCTIEFMNAVRNGEIYCPKSNQSLVAPKCFSPPPIAVLMEKCFVFLQNLLASNNYDQKVLQQCFNLYDEMKKRPPNAAWLVLVYAQWVPEDEIFQKSYRYVRKKKSSQVIEINNADNFFDDLPQLTDAEIKKSNRLMLPKKARVAMKLDAIQKRKQEIIAYENSLANQLQLLQQEEEVAIAERQQIPVLVQAQAQAQVEAEA